MAKEKVVRIYGDAGHGGTDPGAVGYVREEDVNLNITLAFREELEKYEGVEVKLSRETDKNTTINSMAKEANAWPADYVVSIHNNAGGGDGVEIYHSINGGKGKELAANIEEEVKKLGQNSRGLKTRKNDKGQDYYGMIRLTNVDLPAVIVECAFVDNAEDVKIIDTLEEQKAMGKAIAKGVLKTIGIAPVEDKPATTTKPTEAAPAKPAATTGFKVGDRVKPLKAVSYDGVKLASFVLSNNYPVIEVKGNRVVLGAGLNTAFKATDLKLMSGNVQAATKPQAEAAKPATVGSIKKGDRVKPLKAVSYDGVKLASFVLSNNYPVIEVKGDRVVLGNGLNTAFKVTDLKKV